MILYINANTQRKSRAIHSPVGKRSVSTIFSLKAHNIYEVEIKDREGEGQKNTGKQQKYATIASRGLSDTRICRERTTARQQTPYVMLGGHNQVGGGVEKGSTMKTIKNATRAHTTTIWNNTAVLPTHHVKKNGKVGRKKENYDGKDNNQSRATIYLIEHRNAAKERHAQKAKYHSSNSSATQWEQKREKRRRMLSYYPPPSRPNIYCANKRKSGTTCKAKRASTRWERRYPEACASHFHSPGGAVVRRCYRYTDMRERVSEKDLFRQSPEHISRSHFH